MSQLFQTSDSIAALCARLTVAIVLFPHGAQKLLGWWGGFGYTNTMNYFTQTSHLPYLIGLLVILIEFFCPLLLLIGYATRLSALAIVFVMAGIIITVQKDYFFMNWYGSQKGEGMEYFILMIGLCIAIIFIGGGKYSIEGLISPKISG